LSVPELVRISDPSVDHPRIILSPDGVQGVEKTSCLVVSFAKKLLTEGVLVPTDIKGLKDAPTVID
jgi:hypothetical protein